MGLFLILLHISPIQMLEEISGIINKSMSLSSMSLSFFDFPLCFAAMTVSYWPHTPERHSWSLPHMPHGAPHTGCTGHLPLPEDEPLHSGCSFCIAWSIFLPFPSLHLLPTENPFFMARERGSDFQHEKSLVEIVYSLTKRQNDLIITWLKAHQLFAGIDFLNCVFFCTSTYHLGTNKETTQMTNTCIQWKFII